MQIRQVTSPHLGDPLLIGKWFCSDSIMGPDGDPVFRYLQQDGTWGKTTKYFDTVREINELLVNASEPDFTLSEMELHGRAMMREDIERGFEEMDRMDLDEDFYPEDT